MIPHAKSALAGKRVKSDSDLAAVIRRGSLLRDSDETRMVGKGFVFSLYTLADSNVSCSVGRSSRTAPNVAGVTIKSDDRPPELSLLRHVLRATVDVWEPDRGCVGDHGLFDLHEVAQRRNSPVVGYVTYLSFTQ